MQTTTFRQPHVALDLPYIANAKKTKISGNIYKWFRYETVQIKNIRLRFY